MIRELCYLPPDYRLVTEESQRGVLVRLILPSGGVHRAHEPSRYYQFEDDVNEAKAAMVEYAHKHAEERGWCRSPGGKVDTHA